MSTSEESSKAVGIVVTIRVITTTSDIDIATPEQLAPVLHAAIQRLGQLGRTGSLALAALVDSEDDDYNHGSFWIDSIAEGVSHSYLPQRLLDSVSERYGPPQEFTTRIEAGEDVPGLVVTASKA